ncbi:MAG TPA: SDR family oxidoreductase [Acidimicrobiia bacterium]|jgi:NAD(P)-dependent dehydrogenase (short-subunit alcohol dehydrogenase family)|nr:SDR family oxidoreductase [Acidimicrobiia bacterium]
MPNALVTGTSTGIGEACVVRLAERGWRVYAGVRKPEDGDRLRERAAGDVRPVRLDVTDREQIADVVAEIQGEIARDGLQGLVNNAGVGAGGPVEYLDDADWRGVFEVNLFGVVAMTSAAMPLLRAGSGRIVHIGSIGGRVASPGLAPYSASKHALEALAETQRHELARAKTKVRVALVEPGAVATAIWEKADTTVADLERRLDGEGRDRYGWLLDQSRGFIDESRERGVPPSKVADAVEHALTARRPKARYLVGPDARLFGHVLRLAPDRVRDVMVGAGARRWERRGRKTQRR